MFKNPFTELKVKYWDDEARNVRQLSFVKELDQVAEALLLLS